LFCPFLMACVFANPRLRRIAPPIALKIRPSSRTEHGQPAAPAPGNHAYGKNIPMRRTQRIARIDHDQS
jgi:hypothetical protein